MADGVNIDWSLAKPQQNFTSTYANAFDLGRRVAGQQIQGNALDAYMANPQAPIDPRLGAANPDLALQLQGRQQDAQDQGLRVQQATAAAGGDLRGAANVAAQRGATGDVMDLVTKMNDDQRAQAQQHAESIAGALYSVQQATPDPNQRVSIFQHMAQQHPEFGIDPASITPDMVSDAGINAKIGEALGFKGQLEWAQKQADAARAQAKADEEARHNKADEANAAGRLGIERGQLGVAQSRLALERQKYQDTRDPGMSAIPGVDGSPQAVGRGQATIDQVPAVDRPIVQALIDGRYDVPKNAALRNPEMARHLQEAAAVDPTFDVANVATRVATRKDFTSGKSAQTITALNQALGHATLAANDIQGLPGTPVQPLNMAINGLTDPFTGNATAFKTHAGALANEAARVFQGGAPHEAEVKALRATLANPDASATQIKSAVQSLTELLGSRLDALKGQYQQGMGRSSTPLETLHPDAKSAYDRLSHLRTTFGTAPQQTAPQGHGAPQRPDAPQVRYIGPAS